MSKRKSVLVSVVMSVHLASKLSSLAPTAVPHVTWQFAPTHKGPLSEITTAHTHRMPMPHTCIFLYGKLIYTLHVRVKDDDL